MMDLYTTILIEALSKQKIKVTFENLRIENANELVEQTCYETVRRIRKVLDNSELDDFECVERIIALLENIGADGGSRHDFG